MKTTIIDKQIEFEKNVAKILGFTDLSQREFSEQMIIEDWSNEENNLSGTIGFKKNKNNTFDILLIATKDSEVNYISEISLKMIYLMVSNYVSYKGGIKSIGDFTNKVTFCTNLPIEIHSSRAKSLKEQNNFHIQGIGLSFCQKHNLQYCEMY